MIVPTWQERRAPALRRQLMSFPRRRESIRRFSRLDSCFRRNDELRGRRARREEAACRPACAGVTACDTWRSCGRQMSTSALCTGGACGHTPPTYGNAQTAAAITFSVRGRCPHLPRYQTAAAITFFRVSSTSRARSFKPASGNMSAIMVGRASVTIVLSPSVCTVNLHGMNSATWMSFCVAL